MVFPARAGKRKFRKLLGLLLLLLRKNRGSRKKRGRKRKRKEEKEKGRRERKKGRRREQPPQGVTGPPERAAVAASEGGPKNSYNPKIYNPPLPALTQPPSDPAAPWAPPAPTTRPSSAIWPPQITAGAPSALARCPQKPRRVLVHFSLTRIQPLCVACASTPISNLLGGSPHAPFGLPRSKLQSSGPPPSSRPPTIFALSQFSHTQSMWAHTQAVLLGPILTGPLLWTPNPNLNYRYYPFRPYTHR